MKRFAIALLFLAACGGTSTPTKTSIEGAGGDGTDPNPAAEVVTLNGLSNGDRACYVEFTRGDGTEGSQEGDFDLCEGGAKDASGLIGQKITFTTQKASVYAASCEGDMSCTDTDEVDLVVTITAAP